jgi:nitroreductase
MSQYNDTLTVRDAIFGRSSVRAYTPQLVDRPALQMLLEAAVRAPTAMQGEPWQFVIVQDAARLKRLSELAKKFFAEEARHLHPVRSSQDVVSHPDFNVFYDAGTLVVICARAKDSSVVADCWLAAENLMLAAQPMGLGTCVIGSSVSALNTLESQKELGIPAGITAVVPIVVGYPRSAVQPTARHPPLILSWY